MEATVLYHREGDVGIITLNRPHRLNALTGRPGGCGIRLGPRLCGRLQVVFRRYPRRT